MGVLSLYSMSGDASGKPTSSFFFSLRENFFGERKNRFYFSSSLSSFVNSASYAVILFVPACSVWACGVGGLPRRRYSLHVRAVVRPSRPAY